VLVEAAERDEGEDGALVAHAAAPVRASAIARRT
jgi:hypothetical protein